MTNFNDLYPTDSRSADFSSNNGGAEFLLKLDKIAAEIRESQRTDKKSIKKLLRWIKELEIENAKLRQLSKKNKKREKADWLGGAVKKSLPKLIDSAITAYLREK